MLGNDLIDMYAKCGLLQKEQKVLHQLPIWNVVSWSTLIAGYAQQGQGQEALGCFQHTLSKRISPDAIAYDCILKASGTTKNVETGKRIHNDIMSQGLLRKNIMLGNTLVHKYARCGALQKAQKGLEELFVQSMVSWSALIARYAQRRHGHKALGCF
ncbi:hypothetical protein L7F22_060165 [Adiantum nelumboides]|nr:hypothetical protein [Adiantum nelumboides]